MRYFIVALALILSCSCKKNKISNQEKEDEKLILDYAASRGWSTQSTGSGLHYVISAQGNGPHPNAGSNVKVKYSGNLRDGTVFDQNLQGATFNLQNVIKGWQEGIPLFKEGGKGFLLVPSALGYGASGNGKIPPNSVLIFEVELVDVL